MILAVDVDYRDDFSVAAGVLFVDWQEPQPGKTRCKKIFDFGEYVPGQFYKRELPCIMALLEDIDEEIDAIIVDGFVELGPEKKSGLGYHLWTALEKRIPVMGVAKTAFKGTPEEHEVYRGTSSKPLYVTTAGVSLEETKACVRQMHGKHRLPTLLKEVDRLCRSEC